MTSLRKCGCGGEAQREVAESVETNARQFRVSCSACDLRTPWFDLEASADLAWNRALSGAQPPGGESMEAAIEAIVRDVAELPDRTSPPDEPLLMLVTGDELRELIRHHWERAAQPHGGEAGLREARQARMGAWVRECFGDEAMALPERGLRLLEEAAELAQAMGVEFDVAHRTLGKTYGRPPGEPAQEAGGVSTTLLACCEALGISADAAEQTEIERIHRSEIKDKAKRRHAQNQADGTSTLRVALSLGEGGEK